MTQINKTQVKDFSLYNHHVASDAAIEWSKISKVSALPSDINAEVVLTFVSPLVRTLGNTISVNTDSLLSAIAPIKVSSGGTGLTTVPYGEIVYGNSDLVLQSSPNFTFDGESLNLLGTLNTDALTCSVAVADTIVKIQNNNPSYLDIMSYTGMGTISLGLYVTTDFLSPFNTVTKTASIYSLVDGYITFSNGAGAVLNGIYLGSDTATSPFIKINTTNIEFKLGNDSDFTGIKASNLVLTADLSAGGLTKIARPIVTKTSNYPATADDYTVLVDSTGGDVTITLPTSPKTGQEVVVKKIDASANNVVILRGGASTIDNQTSVTFNTQWASYYIQYDGSNWYIL